MTASLRAPAPCWAHPNSRPIKRFLKNNDRVVHGKEIMAIFAGLFLKKSDGLLARTNWRRPACPPDRSTVSSRCSPIRHVQSRGMKITVNHPFEPELAMIRNPLTFSGTPITDYRAPPLLGADTKEVLATIGYR